MVATTRTSRSDLVVARVVLIEGIPGAGKSTTARELAECLRARGLSAGWTEEVSKPHPVKGPARRDEPTDRRRRWLERWGRYTAICSDDLHVFDGAFLQGMVRFLWTDRVRPEVCADFVRDVSAALAPLRPRLVWLAPIAVEEHFRDFVLPTRGAEWERKLCAYVETTPVACHAGWKGRDGLVRFWLAYHALCEELLEHVTVPVLRVPVTSGEFDRLTPTIAGWLERTGSES